MIKSVRIVNFRSLQDVAVDQFGHFTVIAGRNGSGKSNVMRALNLFFNGEVEPGVALDLARDSTRSATRGKKRQQIRVEVEFDLPSSFTFHSRISDRANALGTDRPRRFSLARVWTRDDTGQFVVDAFEVRLPSKGWEPLRDRDLAIQFLSGLIKFRYVANHVHPVRLIEVERSTLQRRLVNRIARDGGGDQTLVPLESLGKLASALMGPVQDEVRKAAPELSGVRVATPTSWTDIALSLDVEIVGSGGSPTSTDLHGSGHQSLLAYALLHLLDTDYSQSFGWRQATIWAIEEPESFLHQELAYRFGSLLRQYADRERFTLVATSHSPTMMAFADVGVLVTDEGMHSLSSAEIIDQSARAGASPFTHPLLAGAPKPLLLVEGKLDVVHLNAAYRMLGRANPFEIREVKDLVGEQGHTGFEHLLRYHGRTISARPRSSPVILLVDTDVSVPKADSLRTKLQEFHSGSDVLRIEESWQNPDLDPTDFSGIECLIGLDLIKSANSSVKGGALLLNPNNPNVWKADKTKVGELKKTIGAIADATASAADYERFQPLLNRLEAALTATAP